MAKSDLNPFKVYPREEPPQPQKIKGDTVRTNGQDTIIRAPKRNKNDMMTSLEIKRLDSTTSPSPQSPHLLLNNHNKDEIPITIVKSPSYHNSTNTINGDPNNPNNNSTDTNLLTFNKYGFVQSIAQSNTNLESSSFLHDRTLSSRKSLSINLKDYLQNVQVEEFAENLPIKVIQSREIKWVEMLNKFDEWMKKR